MSDKTQKFDIVVLAGQSNAEGNGLGNGELIIPENPNVYELYDENPQYYKPGTSELVITLPTKTVFGVSKDRTHFETKELNADFGRSFCEEYVKGGNLKDGRKVLLLRTAVGGTGFSRNEWGVNSILYNRMQDFINYALSLNKENRIVAFLWHQGEHDSVENMQFTVQERFDYYFDKLYNQTVEFRKAYGKDIPFIAGEMVDSWADLPENKPQTDAVESATKKVCEKLGKATVVKSEGLLSNDQVVKNGDNIHFCRKSAIELGKRYYKAYSTLIEE